MSLRLKKFQTRSYFGMGDLLMARSSAISVNNAPIYRPVREIARDCMSAWSATGKQEHVEEADLKTSIDNLKIFLQRRLVFCAIQSRNTCGFGALLLHVGFGVAATRVSCI
jgi:hypothetical protein